VFTQDQDFLAEGCRRQRTGGQFAGIVYAHQKRASIAQCIRDLELIAGVFELAEYANRVEFLPI